ncbi:MULTISPECIES: SDR family oxidoreductase [unclassified Arsukibacterium]|uniref:SDR family oxidoreductase n=1 Tax=unclassified Arsukibacterium TaxID=2635278 RepID=UPI000C663D90|nr:MULTISPECIES: SDR family oxidoreductase [unclassified Arsukibacterium]MAA93479.1 short-chain dehydrogenase [Rheinheimera sp.]MBM32990.1 short-chain dehydrogenase [Rheinheimera sp.]HAW92936.1 short-chain dehydrogenase [Candidatus Azambacteria bacterium]|tara:strand:+ start:144526 stop:145206 length:681 start_codon:yes stop_codon:yes gene_type:complete
MNREKIVVITGASSGIGAATAEKLVAAGHKVVIAARSTDKLNAIADRLGTDKVLAVTADISRLDEIQNVIAQAKQQFGRIDVVFANAGTGLNTAGIEHGDPAEWRTLLDVNVTGLLLTAKASLPALKESQGHFILTSSVAGKITLQGSVYGASKWFAYGFGQNLAAEMKEWQGRCTTICPGMVNTPFFDEAKPDKLDPADIAEAVLFAISANPRCDVREITLMPTK